MKRIKQLLIFFGVNKIYALRHLPVFIADLINFNSLQKKSGIDKKFRAFFSEVIPMLSDKTATHGFDRHYVFHTAWAARKVKEINPNLVVDVSSSLYFSSIISSFIPVKFYDFRPADLSLSGLTSEQGDLMNLPIQSDSLEFVSCMHVIEHIGLGRYGDPLDPNGDIKAINELIRVVKSGGSIIFVTPVGQSSIKFNAHRIYSYEQILERFAKCSLKEFSLIPDDKYGGSILYNADPNFVVNQDYGCGLFHFIKE